MKNIVLSGIFIAIINFAFCQHIDTIMRVERKDFYDMSCLSDSVVYVCAIKVLSPKGSSIYRTLDAGNTWTEIYEDSKPHKLRCMKFINDSIGYAGGSAWKEQEDSIGITTIDWGILLKTTDKGDTWTMQTQDTTLPVFFKIEPVSEDTIYAICLYDNNIYKSTNGGHTWDTTAFSRQPAYIHVMGDTGYVVLEEGNVYRTVNGGNTWDSISTLPFNAQILIFGDGIMDDGEHYTINFDIFFCEDGSIDIAHENNIYHTYDTFQSFFCSSIYYRDSLGYYGKYVKPYIPDIVRICYLSNGMGIAAATEGNDVNYSSPLIKRQKPTVWDHYFAARISRHKQGHYEDRDWEPFIKAKSPIWHAVKGKDNVFYAAATMTTTTRYQVQGVKQNTSVVLKITREYLAIDEKEINSCINVFPNPATDHINIVSANDNIQKVKLYNLYGSLLKEKEETISGIIDISDIPQGVYILTIITDNGIFNKKIIKK